MNICKWSVLVVALIGAAYPTDGFARESVSSRIIQNFTGPFRASQCSREARRAANQRSGNRSGHSRGLSSVAGGAIGGFTHGTSANRWQAVYNTTYRACINR